MAVNSSKISIISVVWFIPIIAIITGIWLSYNYYRSLGTAVTLTIANAEGLRIEHTVLKVLNVEVGKIKNIQLTPDAKSVVMKAYISSDNPGLFAKDAKYWVVKPRIGKGGVTGLSTLISGSYIEIMPGVSAEHSNKFQVLDRPPIMSYQSQGMMLRLVGKNNTALLAPGSAVLYHGIQVGTVEYSYFEPISKTTNYQIFITAPNEKLLGKNINFWVSFGVSINTRDGHIKIEGLNFDNLVGSISFSEPEGKSKGLPVGGDEIFPLYNSMTDVPNNIPAAALYIVGFFDQDISNLNQEATVKYKGVNVGRVVVAPYLPDAAAKKKLFSARGIPVLFYLNPEVASARDLPPLIAKGLVATISSDNLITGTKYIYLYEKTATDNPFYPDRTYRSYPVMPTTVSGFSGLLNNINLVVAKINRLPLNQTMVKVNQNLDELKKTLTAVSAMTTDLNGRQFGKTLNSTLTELSATLKTLSPNSQLYQDLTQLIRNMSLLSEKLNERPNSLLFNYKAHDPVPKVKP